MWLAWWAGSGVTAPKSRVMRGAMPATLDFSDVLALSSRAHWSISCRARQVVGQLRVSSMRRW